MACLLLILVFAGVPLGVSALYAGVHAVRELPRLRRECPGCGYSAAVLTPDRRCVECGRGRYETIWWLERPRWWLALWPLIAAPIAGAAYAMTIGDKPAADRVIIGVFVAGPFLAIVTVGGMATAHRTTFVSLLAVSVPSAVTLAGVVWGVVENALAGSRRHDTLSVVVGPLVSALGAVVVAGWWHVLVGVACLGFARYTRHRLHLDGARISHPRA